MNSDTPRAALEGVRIIDFSMAFAGAAGTAMLGDYGADVIKVEPTRGDNTRKAGSFFNEQEEGSLFVTWNRSKRSVVIDLRHPDAKEVLLRLIDDADVVVQNWRTGVADDVGVGYEAVFARNPQVDYCSMSGFGHTGPLAQAQGTDPVVQSLSGVMSVTGEPGRIPVLVGVPIADFHGAMQTAQMVMLGLLARQRTGRGQHIQASMLGGLLAMLSTRAQEYFATGRVPQPFGPQHPLVVPLQVFETSDGVAMAATRGGKDWPRFCKAVAREDLVDDTRFSTNDRRIANRAELTEILQEELHKHTTAEWIERFRAHGALINPIWNIADVLESDQIKALAFVEDVPHWRLGTVKQLRPHIAMSDTPGRIRPAPRLGEATIDVLAESGFSLDEISQLLEHGVVVAHEQTALPSTLPKPPPVADSGLSKRGSAAQPAAAGAGQAALAGVRVLDFTTAFAGAGGTALLADYGADVIKVESLRGDHTRKIGSYFDEVAEGSLFLTWNRGKRGIVVDYRSPLAQDVLMRLIDQADVVVQNWRTGIADEIGVGYEAVAARNPRTVFCSITGFGETGPMAYAQGTDPVVQALSGVMSVTGEPHRTPVLIGVPIADFTGAVQTAQMVMLGLLARETTGRGQHVQASMLGGMLAMLSTRAQEYFATGRVPQPFGPQHPLVVPLQVFYTKDSVAVAATPGGGSAGWPKFCQAIGRPDLADDERFSSNDRRIANRNLLTSLLQEIFLTKTTEEWVVEFRKAGSLINPVWSIKDVLESEQVKELGLIEEVEHWRLGSVKQLRPQFLMSDTPAVLRTSPRMGEHTVEVLREAGFDPDEIGDLLDHGIVMDQHAAAALLEGGGSLRREGATWNVATAQPPR